MECFTRLCYQTGSVVKVDLSTNLWLDWFNFAQLGTSLLNYAETIYSFLNSDPKVIPQQLKTGRVVSEVELSVLFSS